LKLLQFSLEDEERPCTPKDFLNSTPYFDVDEFNTVVGGENTLCLPVCLRTEYQVSKASQPETA